VTLLLDTHVWLWWQMAPERLSNTARERIADPATVVLLSTVSTWEMAIKVAAGKLQLPRAMDEMIPESLLRDGFGSLPLQHHHCFELSRLPMHHRDPFDRMLIAQAKADRLTLVTVDRQLERYEIELLPAN
jgi:PIN domain nuclease of toxin-antitoxin system